MDNKDDRIAELEADRGRLRKALEAAKPPLEEFCRTNPKWQYDKGRQDPCGGHAALSMVRTATIRCRKALNAAADRATGPESAEVVKSAK